MLACDYLIKGEQVFLPHPDPAIVKVEGYRRFLVGQDIAQAVDRNAYAIILDERLPIWTDRGQDLGPRRREIVRADFLPQMSYSDLAIVTRNLMMDPAIAGRAYLCCDAGGVGRAYADLLNTKGVQHTRVQITGGESENEVKERGVSFNNVGKNRLLSALNSALHVKDLTIGNFPKRDELRQELESFEVEITAAGRMKIDGGTAFSHNDLAMAASLAFYLSDHRSVGAFYGARAIAGYW